MPAAPVPPSRLPGGGEHHTTLRWECGGGVGATIDGFPLARRTSPEKWERMSGARMRPRLAEELVRAALPEVSK